MAQNNSFDNNDGHLILSHDLLNLLQWLIDHEAEALKKLVERAVEQGFATEYQAGDETIELHLADDSIQQSVIEFLGLLDTLLIEASNEQNANRVINRTRMPVLDHIDSMVLDDQTVQASIDKTNSKLEHNPQANAQELLLQELLKRWNPDKTQTCN
jgi:hypothetical protein